MDPRPASATARGRRFGGILAAAVGLAAGLTAGTGAFAAGAEGPTAETTGPKRALHFDVFLDERPIGFQRFELAPGAEGLTVETRARFELTLLRIKALDYDHHDREHWRGGCLHSIESRTRQNGKDYRVTGRATAGGFTVEGQEGHQRLASCVGTFSYWDKAQLLRQTKLLNSQTGEYLAVATKALGRGALRLGDREIAVDRYVIEGEDLEIHLAYTQDGSEWVALDSPLFAGRELRYRRRLADLDAPATIVPSPPAD
ncbi:MAG: hypothetical protein IPK00_20145 [Deltaproteobacteria bacterium]|nr:hypothetical protein [Deltaproteobacteria bacterium]